MAQEGLQSVWYLHPGQTLENTRIDDRSHALIANKEGWEKLTHHLRENEIQEQQQEAEMARKKYLKEGSYAMTKDWDNSLEKIRQRRIEEHEKKIQSQKDERMARFLEIRAEQKAERDRYVQDVKKRLFMMQEKPRNLNSALMTTETMYERKLQEEFNAKIKERDRGVEEKYAAKVKQDAEDEKQENLSKQQERVKKNKENQKALKEQICEIRGKEKLLNEQRMQEGIIDNQTALEEMEGIKKFEEEKSKQNKIETKKSLADFLEKRAQLKEEDKQQQLTEDKIIEVYARAKCQIEMKKKEQFIEMKEERMKKGDFIAAKLTSPENDVRKEQEKAFLENGIRDFEQRDLERDAKDKANVQKLRKERIDDRKLYLTEQEKRKAAKKEIEKFLFLQRLKNQECYEDHEKEKAAKLKEKMLQYGKEIREYVAMVASDTTEQEVRDAEYKALLDKNAKLDKKFLEYGDEVRGLAKERGRSTLPIDRVIEKYKKENGLEVKQKNIAHLMTSLKINDRDAKMARKRCPCRTGD